MCMGEQYIRIECSKDQSVRNRTSNEHPNPATLKKEFRQIVPFKIVLYEGRVHSKLKKNEQNVIV